MNLIFRLLYVILTARFRKIDSFFGPIETPLRVTPFDLDILGHMTNSRYFAIMDVARTDLIARVGILGELRKRGWYPIVVEESMHFRRALNPWVRFRVKTEVIGYDEKHFILQQSFLKGDKVTAIGVVRARFLGPEKQRVSPQDVLALAGSSELPERSLLELEQARYRYFQELMQKENEILAATER